MDMFMKYIFLQHNRIVDFTWVVFCKLEMVVWAPGMLVDVWCCFNLSSNILRCGELEPQFLNHPDRT